MDKQNNSAKTHPKETANIFSLITFFYTFNIFKKGFQKDLESTDLYEVLSSCKSDVLGDKLEFQLKLEQKKHKKVSIIKLLWTCFGKCYILFGLLQLIMSSIFVLVVPEAVGKLISFFSPGQTVLSKEDAYFYAGIVIGCNIIHFIYIQNYMMALTEFGIKIRTAICSLIFRKSLKLSNGALSEISIGRIVTMITKDVNSIEILVLFGNEIWIGLIQAVIISFIIYQKVGLSTFVGVGFLFGILVLQIITAKVAASYRLKSCKKTDERLQLTQEILSALKVIKMYAWENFFSDKIRQTRKEEIGAVFKLFYIKIIIIVVGIVSSKIAFYLLIMSYVWLGNNITGEIVYFIKICFGKLNHVLGIMLPLAINFCAEFYATIDRLNTLLAAEEISINSQLGKSSNNTKVTFINATMKNEDKEILKNISLVIEKGLNIVVGHTGCGKTTFIKMLLHNNNIEESISIRGNISYAAQDPWLFPSSIRNNILFGEDFVADRYEKVLEICALKQDLNTFENGDDTIVGDHGLNLSKGQQARISLARAVYKNSDIYLLDDCLASLDGFVSKFIFDECIRTFLNDKLVVLVTNNEDHILKGDEIIEIKPGQVKISTAIQYRKTEILGTEICEEHVPKHLSDKMSTRKDASQEIYSETKKSGKVDLEIYKSYLMFGGGYFMFFCIIFLFVIVQSIISYGEKLVGNWVNVEQELAEFKKNFTDSLKYEDLVTTKTNLLQIYTFIIIALIILSLLKSFSFFVFCKKASLKLHDVMLLKIMGAKMIFFDTHFLGNIINRFSKDLCTLDEALPFTIDQCFEILFTVFGTLALVALVTPIFLIPAAVFFVLVYFLRLCYLRTGRSLQRLEASTRSPLIGHLSCSLEGITTIRAFQREELIKNEFDKHLNLYTSANYNLHNTMRALGFILDCMCSVFISLVIARFLIFPTDTTVGNVGIAISQAFLLTGITQFGIRKWVDFENQMTSVERALEYTKVEQEPKYGETVHSWPCGGNIIFENVSLQYQIDKIAVLKEISFNLMPKKKLAIVGRTGAGKSSIISALFRLYDIEGKVVIDNVDIRELSLHCLRSNIAIIPQDPILFSGTIRENIDPLKKYTDEEIWKTIKLIGIENLITTLTCTVDKTNFSSGQKQLICLARALVRKNPIIILDEVTASLDQEMEALIQKVITDYFEDCTVIVIAHRLRSVIAADLVMVIDNGKIVEKDDPKKLMENKNSLFFQMIQETSLF